jgi:hypothetical protein
MAHEPLEQYHLFNPNRSLSKQPPPPRPHSQWTSRVRRRSLTPQLDDNLIEFGIGRAAAEWKQAGSLSGRLGGLDSGS